MDEHLELVKKFYDEKGIEEMSILEVMHMVEFSQWLASRPTQAAPDAATPRRRMVACPNCETMFGVELSPNAAQVS